MKEVYLIYASIPSILFDCKIHEFVKDSTKYNLKNMKYTGLYAWTTKKDLLKEFLEFREGAKSIYNVIKRDFTKEEYKAFKEDNYYEELNYYTFYHNKDEDRSESINNTLASIVCTREEYDETYTGDQYVFDYMAQVINSEYLVFNEEFKLALDSIGYCDMFNRIYEGLNDCGDYEDFYHDRNELTYFNNSYGLSYYGNNSVDILKNKLAIFINIYYEMIVGFDPNTEIKLLIYR